MPLRLPRRTLYFAAGGLAILGAALGLHLHFRTVAQRALAEGSRELLPLKWVPLPASTVPLGRWGAGQVEAVAVTPEGLLTAGGSGVSQGRQDLGLSLPSMRASAMTLWRGRPVVALAAGGWFLRRGNTWEEAQNGDSRLHVRTLLEAPGGQLLIGAQEGLFRATWGARTMECLDHQPVRTLALGPGGLCVAGGEQGLRKVSGNRTEPLPTPDPWIEWAGFPGGELWVLTPLGLARGQVGRDLRPVTGGSEVRQAVQVGEEVHAMGPTGLLRFDTAGRAMEVALPDRPLKALAWDRQLFIDTPSGLFHQRPEGWRLVRPRGAGLPPGSSHINTLATMGTRVFAGLFDGGLIVGEPSQDGTLAWNTVGGSTAWGVNAILPVGGTLYVASLRGAARFDGTRLQPLSAAPAGSAYALAASPEGLAIGYGQGVLLGGGRMLSAFHGLPGNQVLALLPGDDLLVGTPSGLGAIRDGRVTWRVVAGEGRLPHPWITALARVGEAVLVGTYGGGVAQRTPGDTAVGSWRDFPETAGFKVNPGCLLEAAGMTFLGTDGQGLHRLSPDGQRFRPVDLPLPSRRITALAAEPESLLVGTDEGLVRIPFALLRESH